MAIGHDIANAKGIIITGSLNNDQTVQQEVNNKEFQCQCCHDARLYWVTPGHGHSAGIV